MITAITAYVWDNIRRIGKRGAFEMSNLGVFLFFISMGCAMLWDISIVVYLLKYT